MASLALVRRLSFRQPESLWMRCYLRLPLPPLSFFLMIAAYLACNEFNAEHAVDYWGEAQLASPLDHAIPFWPWMIFVYIGNFAFYLLPKSLLRQGADGRIDYLHIQRALLLVTALSCAIFLLFPASVEMREAALSGIDRSAYPARLLDACAALFAVDASFNAWPSLHVSQPLLIILATHHLTLFGPLQRFCNWAFFFLLALSALTLKQHYLWDLCTGMLLALLAWRHWLLPRLDSMQGRSVIGSAVGRLG